MLNHPPATACPDLDRDAASTSEATDVCSDAPNLQEARNAIARLKNRWAAGPDGIPPELLKCATGPVAAALHSLFLKIWREGTIPAEWRDGIITALYKGKGSKAHCGNYHPITLLSVPGRSSRIVVYASCVHQALTADEPQAATVRLHGGAQQCRLFPGSKASRGDPQVMRAVAGCDLH